MRYLYLKRILDLFISITSLPFLIPIYFLICILIKFNSKGPIIFKQKRIGLNQKEFIIYKFRTMKIDNKRIEKQTYIGDKDIIIFGNFLRRYKLDELPQLLNIIKGDMSFVGPRPCLPSTLKNMPKWALERFEIKPGLTGLSQVSGNINLTWPERWIIDTKYLNDLSFLLDIKIIFKTLFVLLNGERIRN